MLNFMKKYILSIFIGIQFLATVVYATDSPESFLGYTLGSKFTSHEHVMAYFKYVAESSPKVQLKIYGKTWEDRPLMVAVVSSPENMDNLENIRLNNLRRTGTEQGIPENDGISIVWLSYNVHGNEPSSTETAMKVLYALASSDSNRYDAWLENTVVIIDPCLNPDGRERYVNWYVQTAGSKPDPALESAEHHELWPGGRFNHYLFDLNRDWVWLTQKETISRISLYHSWMPHLHIDFHEQGINNNYYFAPAAIPFHEQITPWQKTFQKWVGDSNAKYFNEKGWLFFTEESYDLLYPGFGDTYPTFNGSVGITYEMPGNTRGGLKVITRNGDTLTLEDRIERHFVTSMASIEVCSKHADRLIDEFTKYFEIPAKKEKECIYLVKNSNDFALDQMTALLDQHQIRYSYCVSKKKMTGVSYQTGMHEKFIAEKNDLIVDARQPNSKLTKVLFEPNTKLYDSLTYDITAWSLPFTYGLNAYIIDEKPEVGADKYNMEADASITGEVYAFIVSWENMGDVKLLAGLLKSGIRVRRAGKPISFQGEIFPEGSLMVTRSDNKSLGDEWPGRVRKLISGYGQEIIPVISSSDIREANFGSQYHSLIDKPRIALAYGRGTYATQCGEIWYYFDREIEYSVSRILAEDLMDMDLSEYDVLIFPDGYYQDMIGDSGFDKIKQWVRKGGHLILFQDAVDSFTGKDKFSLKKYDNFQNDDTCRIGPSVYKNIGRDYLTQTSLGSLLTVRLDNSHPLAYGYGQTYISLHSGSDLYELLKEGWNVGYTDDAAKVISGFAGYKLKSDLSDKLIFGVEDVGNGSVVYLLDDVLFRGFWNSGKLMFSNALFMF